MTPAYLSLGSNVEPLRHLRAAVSALRERFGEVELSQLYRTPAVGFEGDDFLNAAARIDSDLEPAELDAWLHALEAAQGRRRDVPRFSSRTLDIDIVLYGDRIVRRPDHLEIPRPELHHAFVLKPLADIAADVMVPGDGRTVGLLWAQHPQHNAAFAAVPFDRG